MFYIAEAFLEGDGLSFSKHSAVIAAFGKDFAQTGRVPLELHRYLIDAQETRQEGDYGPYGAVSEGEGALQIERAERFLRLAEELIGPLPPTTRREPAARTNRAWPSRSTWRWPLPLDGSLPAGALGRRSHTASCSMPCKTVIRATTALGLPSRPRRPRPTYRGRGSSSRPSKGSCVRNLRSQPGAGTSQRPTLRWVSVVEAEP